MVEVILSEPLRRLREIDAQLAALPAQAPDEETTQDAAVLWWQREAALNELRGTPPSPHARSQTPVMTNRNTVSGASALDLFADLEPAVDTSFATTTRIQLDETSWIEHVPGWLTGSAHLFDQLLTEAPWEQRYRMMFGRRFQEPRLTAEYPDIAGAPQELLHTVADTLSNHFDVPYRKLWMNLYRDHRGSTGWHGDLIGKVQEVSTVPVLSLGATRRFLIRPAEGGASVSLILASGDLVVMGGRAQRDWRHSVPKQNTPAGPRISVNFAPDLD
ncbi:alpha-ketoglutarate-dependent dioxygenase AlkB [Actinophytocola oryzae]|uniref:Alkylated DNA repair dioxygenase AlkB n=1 Tax=Actinophytocola oryzae TaxID=502181 RepID=A0A4R7VQ65_9PSEU|nr:alpha-ketoglutarate-dependent dioxygenase AlkB [Actinophytocola oryzae]TDV51876.1 alkylated DNA repair dioxygenase AlkB [Actinophytocola oryzae]